MVPPPTTAAFDTNIAWNSSRLGAAEGYRGAASLPIEVFHASTGKDLARGGSVLVGNYR